MKDINEPAIRQHCYKFFTMMYVYIKTYRRTKCLESMVKNRITVLVCDRSWENVSFSKKLRILNTNYMESLHLYKRAKVLIQEMAEFNNGAHNRIFDAALSGAAIVSEYSSYIAEKFMEGRDLELYKWDNLDALPNMVNNLLLDESRRLAMVYSAYNNILSNHLPKNRAEKILTVVDLYYANGYAI